MKSNQVEIYKLAVLENMVIIVATVVLVGGMYMMGAGNYAFWGLILVLFINSTKTTDGDDNETR